MQLSEDFSLERGLHRELPSK